MEGPSRGSRRKRGGDTVDMKQGEESQCQGYSKRASYAQMVVKEAVVDSWFNPLDDLSFPLAKSSPTFVNASSEALATFDFSELTGITCLNKRMGINEASLEPTLDVPVPGVLYHVDIPRQLMFTEVCQRLNLKMYGMGLVIESSEVFSGWIDMAVPFSQIHAAGSRKKFYGQGCVTKYGAIESVCSAVLVELWRNSDVVIRDFNYPKLKAVEANLAREVEWSSMIKELFAKQKGKTKHLSMQFECFRAGLMDVCHGFSDILPIAVANDNQVCADKNSAKIVYNGHRPPMSRIEQFAFKLANVMANGFSGDS